MGWRRFKVKRPQPIVSLSQRSRHPCNRMPIWLNDFADEIRYWLRSTSRRRHSEPFNKRSGGHARRMARKLKHSQRELSQ